MVVIVAQLSYIEHGSQEVLMAATAFVRARIDETLKDEAAAVLAELGLTVSDVVRMTLTRVAKDHALPFELKVPNAEKRAAIEARSEGPTSETQAQNSILYAGFCLKKKSNKE